MLLCVFIYESMWRKQSCISSERQAEPWPCQALCLPGRATNDMCQALLLQLPGKVLQTCSIFSGKDYRKRCCSGLWAAHHLVYLLYKEMPEVCPECRRACVSKRAPHLMSRNMRR